MSDVAEVCEKCHRPLKDEVSQRRRYGPVCWRRVFGSTPARPRTGGSPSLGAAGMLPLDLMEPLPGLGGLERDPAVLFRVARMVIRAGVASIPALMRSLLLGVRTVERLLDQLAQLGIVDPAQPGHGDRAVHVPPARLDDALHAIQHHTPI